MSRSLLLIIIAALGFIYIWKNCTKIREGLYPCKSNDWTGGPTRCCPVRTGNYKDLRKGADSQLGQAIAAWCKNPIFYDEGKSPPTRTTDGTKFTASYQAAFGCPKGGVSPQHPLELPPSQMQKCSYQGAPAPICDLAAWENNDCAAKFDQQAQGGIAAFRYGEDAPPGGTEFQVGGNHPNCVYAPEAIPLSLALTQDGGLVLQDSPNFCENIQEEGDSGGDTSGKHDCEQNTDVKFWRSGFFPNMPPSLATYLENNGFGSFCEWGKGEYGENNTLKTGNCPSFQTCNPGSHLKSDTATYDGDPNNFQGSCCVAGRDGDTECIDKADGTVCGQTLYADVECEDGGSDCPVKDRTCKNGYCCSKNACKTCHVQPFYACCNGRKGGSYTLPPPNNIPNPEYPATWLPRDHEGNYGVCGLDPGHLPLDNPKTGYHNPATDYYTTIDLSQTLDFCTNMDSQGDNIGACFGYAGTASNTDMQASDGSRPGTWYQKGDSEKCCIDNPLPSTNCSCPSSWGPCNPHNGTCGPGTRTRKCTPASGDGTPCTAADESQSCTVKCQNCPYSAFSDPVVPGKTGSPCLSAGGTLNPGGSCSLACAPGYTPSTSTYNCSTEGTLSGVLPTCTKKKCPPVPSLNPFVIPDSTKTTPCEVGKVLETGETCYVTCKQGYEAASGSGVYSCSSNGTYTPGNLKCKKKLCPPIPTFDTNTMVGGPDPPCTPSEQLAPGKKCNISCKAAYNSTGSGTYTCGPDATFTTHSTLHCSAKTCVIPQFGDGIIAGPPRSCKVGEKLAEGTNCNVMCKPGYTPSHSGVYSCSEDGVLTNATLTCTPPNPTCALDFKCPVNQHLKNPLPTTPCASSTCVAGDCCIDNPQCSTLKSCNAGRRFKQNHENIICPGANCEDTDCCEAIPQPTCQGYPCPTHYSILADADTIKCAGATCQDPECCVAKSKPTCVDDPILCPQGYDSKPNIEDITCKGYQCNAADCCIGRPPTPPPPNITDITKTRKIDNRKWINNTQRIRKFNVVDDRHQTMVQSDPSFYYDDFEIRGGRFRGDNAYPPTTIIVSDDRELELPWRDNDRLY